MGTNPSAHQNQSLSNYMTKTKHTWLQTEGRRDQEKLRSLIHDPEFNQTSHGANSQAFSGQRNKHMTAPQESESMSRVMSSEGRAMGTKSEREIRIFGSPQQQP